MVALLSVAVTFLLLGAEFVGWVQILIYVGAIVILFLFGLMLTKAPIGRDALDGTEPAARRPSSPALLFAGLVVPDPGRVPVASAPARRRSPGGSAAIGEALFRDYVLPFEAVSFVLLAALIGAIVLARKDEGT